MNKHIEDLQQYIETGSMPGSYSLFFEDCKDVYDKRCQDFKAFHNRFEIFEVDTMQLIINKVHP